MYNRERKEEFIKDYTSNGRTAYYMRGIFNKFEYAEENEWHEDLCKQPKERLEKIINAQTGTRMQSAERAFIVVRDYVKWCRRNGIETSNGVFEIKVNTIESVKKLMVGNPVELQERLDLLFGTDDDKTVNCVYRAFFWLAYAGMTDVDALEVEKNEVDLVSEIKCVRHNGKRYRIYDVAVETFRNACTLTEFERNDVPYKTMIPRGESDKLISGRTGDMKLLSIRRAIGKREEATGVKLSFGNVYYSGLFYRTYSEEVKGYGMSFEAYVNEQLETNKYTYNQNRTRNKVFNQKIRALELDYDCWKCAFAK